VRCADDREIQSSIEELKNLTSSIERRAEALRTQQGAITSFMRGNIRNLEARTAANETRNDAWKSESVHMTTAASPIRSATENLS
jgi:hypothetical protein